MFELGSLNTTTFSWQAALSLCHASQLAYSDEQTVLDTAANWGFTNTRYLADDETQGFFASAGGIGVLCFRGTESVGDWLTNIQIINKKRPYGRVHRGFYKAFKDVRGQVLAALSGQSLDKLFFTGHSLGGALATIAMPELESTAVAYKAAYTYGQPRVGKKSFQDRFADTFGDVFYRVANKRDIVPKVPPTYRHVGQYLQLTDEEGLEGIVTEPPAYTAAQFAELQAQILEAIERYEDPEEGLEAPSIPEDEYIEGIIPGVEAHKLELYIERLRAKADAH